MILAAQGKYLSIIKRATITGSVFQNFVEMLIFVSLLDQNPGITLLRVNKASSSHGNQ